MTSAAQEDVGQSVAGRTELSGFNSFVQAGFLQLSQEAGVPMQMHSSANA